MAKVCDVTGKRPTTGNNVSHSNRKTKRRFLPNLFKKRFVDPETGETFRATVSAHGLKILTKQQGALLKLARSKRK